MSGSNRTSIGKTQSKLFNGNNPEWMTILQALINLQEYHINMARKRSMPNKATKWQHPQIINPKK